MDLPHLDGSRWLCLQYFHFCIGDGNCAGDINGDGVFDYMDISRLYYLYTEDTFEADEALCDYNGDGVFDYYDITKLYADFRKIM